MSGAMSGGRIGGAGEVWAGVLGLGRGLGFGVAGLES